MRTRSNRLDDLIDSYHTGDVSRDGSLYGDYAPLYDAFYSKHFDYEKQADIVEEYSELRKDSTIVEGCCGTGRLLRELENRGYESMYGVDLNQKMLDIARENTTRSKLVCADIFDFYTPEKVDGYYLMGHSLGHISPERRFDLFNHIYDVLDSKATFIFSYFNIDVERGHKSESLYNIGKWEVKRDSMSVRTDDNKMQSSFVFNIKKDVDKRNNYLKTGMTFELYLHDPRRVVEDLENAGFGNITVVESDRESVSYTIARKIGD